MGETPCALESIVKDLQAGKINVVSKVESPDKKRGCRIYDTFDECLQTTTFKGTGKRDDFGENKWIGRKR